MVEERPYPAQGAPLAGTQSIRRTANVLRALALRSQSGSRIVDIAASSGLEAPTVHRILQALVAEGMAFQDRGTRRYFPGPLLFELGLSVEPHFPLRELAQPAVALLAQETGDTAFLAVRSGVDALCIDRKDGNFPIKAFTMQVGSKVPLGVGAGGLAMLAALPEKEARAVLDYNAPRLSTFGTLSAPALLHLWKEARSRGYAEHHRESGIAAIGVAIRGPEGAVAGSLSIAAIESRLPVKRIEIFVRALVAEARKIEARLARRAPFSRYR